MNWLFTSGDWSIGASASTSVLPMNIQGWFPVGMTSDLLAVLFIQMCYPDVSRILNTLKCQISDWNRCRSQTWARKIMWLSAIQTARSAPSLLFGHLSTSAPGHLGWLCLDWSFICCILLGFGFLDFFLLGSKLYLSFVLLSNKSSSENLFWTKAFKG